MVTASVPTIQESLKKYSECDMEKRKIIVELEVLTARMTDREITRDVERLAMNLKGIESGQTTIEEIEVKEIR